MTTITQHNNAIETAPKTMNSAFYIGSVFHRRLTPKIHHFNYPLYMAFIDLDEIEALNNKHWWFSSKRWAPLQLKASDYFKTITPSCLQTTGGNETVVNNNDHPHKKYNQLKNSAINIAQYLGADISTINRVCMLAQLRSFGFYFSPVNFFFLYEDREAKYLVAEVSNTPWNKKHCYLIDVKNPKETPKTFHVSPFMDLNMAYQWAIKPPEENTVIRIENRREGHLLFSAIFSAKRQEITAKNILKVFLQWPVISATIVRRIYWQAINLFLKGVRYVPYQIK